MQKGAYKPQLITLIAAISLCLRGILFAQEPSPQAPAEKTSPQAETKGSEETATIPQKTEKTEETKETLEMKPEAIEQVLASYKFTLKQLLAEAERSIKRVNEDIKQEEILQRNKTKEAEIREHFEKGNALYQERKFKEAKKEWERALDISRQPELKQYVQESERIEYKKEIQKKEEIARKIAPLYKEARYNFNLGQLDRVKEICNEILSLDPSQGGAKEYLDNKIPAKLNQLQAEEKRQRGIREEKELSRLRKEKDKEERLAAKKQPRGKPKRKEEEPRQRQEDARLEKQRKEEERLAARKQRQQELKQKEEIVDLEKEERERQRRQRQEQARLERQQYEGELAQRKALRGKVSSLYKEALSYYAGGRLEQAEDAFNQILSLDPGQAKAREYLDNKIPAKLSQLQAEAERQEEIARREEERRQKEEDARLEKERQQQELAQRQALRRKASSLYKEAVSYYASDRLLQAKELFLEVLAFDPENPQARNYLDNKIPARARELQALRQKRKPVKKKR